MEWFGTSKRLRLRRPDRCARCGREFNSGDEALWFRAVGVVTCVGCSADVESPEAPASVGPEVTVEHDLQVGTAGASARREYERRRQKREDHAQERLGRLGIALARLINEPQSTRAWERGAKGEAFVGERLEKRLADSEVKILHDRQVPGHGKANLDHIAIGPGGVTVIDTKNYRGEVRLQRVGGLFSERRAILTIGGQDRTRLVKAVEVQVELVRTALAGTEHAGVDIAGALCFGDVDGLPLLAHPQLRGITIDGPRRVARLVRRPGGLSADAIDRLWRLIAQTFPPA